MGGILGVQNQFTTLVDASDIQPALDDLPSTGGVVDARTLTGAYTLTSAITLPAKSSLWLGDATLTFDSAQMFLLSDDCQLVGIGIDRTIFLHGTNAGANLTHLITTVSGGASRCRITDFTLNGDSANQVDAGNGIHFDATGGAFSDIEIDHVYAKNIVDIPIRIENITSKLKVHDNKLENWLDGNQGGIGVAHTSTSLSPTNYRIYNNDIDGSVTNNSTGIKISSTASTGTERVTDVKVYGNTVKVGDNTGAILGIELFGDNNGGFNGGIITDNYVYGDAASTNTFG
ncbi:MAG: hypothetical protein ACR2QW_09310, partial [bacterium]